MLPQDEYGRTEYLRVSAAHHADCTFGPGFFRLNYGAGSRYCQSMEEVEQACRLLEGIVRNIRVERDGYCLDGMSVGDANTPDVIDGEWWLSLSREDGMRELGLTRDADYARTYKAIESAVGRRNDRASQGGVRARIVIKRPGARVTDVHV